MSGEVIESPTQLRMLAADGELAGKTLRGPWAAPGVSLENADLDSVSVERVGLAEANLAGVRLEHATLKSVDLTGAVLTGALLHRVRAFDNTRLTRADLSGVEMRRCDLGPQLWMEGAIFTGAKIQGSTFNAVELARASFKNAVLLRTHFSDYANAVWSLMRTSFVEAVLIEVDLHEVNLYGTDLSRALLIRCDLRGATLAGASMVGARLIDCRTEGADLSDTKV
jgi:uncharacterized protein YjbI with pentapeptide repeats